MKQYRYLSYMIGGLFIALSTSDLQAQNSQSKDTTMSRTVVVEQEYSPIINDAAKINVLPKIVEPTVSKKDVEYATTFFPATSIMSEPMSPYVAKEIQSSTKPGFIRAGYGNYGNLDVLANYLFRISDRDKLNVYFQMDGMNGKLTMPGEDLKWKSYYYRTRASVDYTHQFDKIDFNLAGHFGLSNFNLNPFQPGKQKFTSGDLHLGVKSTDENYPLQFNAETNLMMYDRQNNNTPIFSGSIGETQIHTKGLVSGAITDEQIINIGLDMYNLFYNNDLTLSDNTNVYDNRTAINLNPYYALSSDNWNLHLGANVDFSLGSGKTFRVSPGVIAQYIFSDSYVLYGQATGGKQINNFRRMEALCPYVLPDHSVVDTYEQVNAQLGFKASPYPGLWLNIYGGYQDLKDDTYEYYGSKYTDLGVDPDKITSAQGNTYNYLNLNFTNTSNFYAGMKINYEYKDIVALSLGGIYRNWDSKDTDLALLLKPAYEINFNASLSPIRNLKINLGYDYEGRKKVLDLGKMSAISNLYAGASYVLFNGVSVYVKINNILNKKYEYYLGYPTEEFSFLGGLSLSF